MATTRDDVQKMLDSIPDNRLPDALAALKPLIDPVALALANAPDDDEEFTDEDLADLAAARARDWRGETIPHEVVKRELGW